MVELNLPKNSIKDGKPFGKKVRTKFILRFTGGTGRE